MANDLSDLMPKILARGVMHLRSRCIMPRVVNSDMANTPAQKGQTIDVQVPTAVGTRDVTPGPTSPANVDHDAETVQVTLNQWKQNDPIHLTDQEMTQIDAQQDYLPVKLTSAIEAIAAELNTYIHGKYPKVFNVYGTAGTTPFATTVKGATRSRALLNSEKAPLENRFGVLDFDAEATALELAAFSDAEKIMSASVKMNGEIGTKFGINWAADDNVQTHTAGTVPATLAVNKGAGYAIGDAFIDMDEGAGAGGTIVGKTLLVGDIIKFANHDQTYAVVANASSADYAAGVYTGDATDDIHAVGIYPPLRAAVVDDEVVTLTASHVVNLVFHRDAFAFAMRPLEDGLLQGLGGTKILSMTDPHTGLTMRLEVKRQHKQVTWEFDVLYGAELVRPELAVRLLG